MIGSKSRTFDTPNGEVTVSAGAEGASAAVEFKPNTDTVALLVAFSHPSLVAYALDLIREPSSAARRQVADWLADNLDSWHAHHVPPTLTAALRAIR